jgi:beta-galactosidase
MLSKYRLSWEVPFSPGSLRVVGYTDGKAVAEKTIQTAGEPTRIRLEPDRLKLNADGSDLSYVTVRVEDKNGNLCPLSDNLIHFEVEGAGKIAAVGNGNAATTEPFIASQRHAFNGLCMLIIQASKETGEISIRATSEGLLPYGTTITAE